jgi:hypothetical protein
MRRRHFFPLPFIAAFSVLGVHVGAEPFFNSAPLSDDELGQARGGFNLPNGMKIDFGVLISTRVDGLQVMQTQMRIAGDEMMTSIFTSTGQRVDITGGTTAYVDENGVAHAVAGKVTATSGLDGAQAQAGDVTAQASLDGSSAQAGTVLVEGSQAGASAQIGSLHLSVGAGGAQVEFPSIKVTAAPGSGPATAPTPAVEQQAAASTPVGQTVVSIGEIGVLATTELPDLLVKHAIGREISSMIINTGNGRVVDNEVSINLRLDDVQPFALGSAGYRVQSLGLEAAMWRATGG